jgi:hypothetical protein
MPGSAEFRQCLPDLLSACARSELPQVGLRFVDAAVREAPTDARHQLLMDKARFLIRLERYVEAGEMLRDLEDAAGRPAQRYGAVVLRAQMLIAQGREDPGVDLCRMVATADDCPRELRAGALRTLGAHYEETGRFREAALAYSGKCPQPAGGNNQ